MSRYGSRSEVDIDARYEDRRSTRGPRGTRTETRYDDVDVDFRRGSGPVPARERQSVLVRERDDYERRGTTPAFLRDDYGGNTTAGAMVLRERDTEDITYTSGHRRRSPSPEKREREEIVIRRDERSESRPAPPRPRTREQSREREEIIIRRDERSESVPPAPRRREQSREREEIIIRRDERESVAPPRRAPPREYEREREEIIIKKDDRDTRSRFEEDVVSQRSYRPPPPPVRDNVDRSEIIIRREQIEPEEPPPPPRVSRRNRYDEEVISDRRVSRERARSRGRSHEDYSDDEIIIRRDKSENRRGGEDTREEIIIRRSSRSRSPSPTASVSTRPPPIQEPQIIYAPQIHQEVITHHRHVDHGYEVRNQRRENVYSRPPSPPSPPPPPAPMSVRARSRSMSEERIEIKRSDTRNGRRETEDITISRNERSVSRGPPPSRVAETRIAVREEEEIDYSSRRGRSEWEERNIEEEAEYYNDRALSRGYAGEAYHGATRDWGLVDIPPGTRRVKMDGAGGGAQEITWKRYDGNRRAKFYPDGDDEGYTTDPGRQIARPRPIREPSPELPAPTIAARYGNRRDPRDGLWTEVTKDLVVKEAIEEMGWEYQETDEHYYIFRYMEYVSTAITRTSYNC